MKPRRIELHIEELVLTGVPPAQRYAVAEALQQQLAQLFAERGVPASLAGGGEIEHLDAGEISQVRGAPPHTLGARAGQASFQALSNQRPVTARGLNHGTNTTK